MVGSHEGEISIPVLGLKHVVIHLFEGWGHRSTASQPGVMDSRFLGKQLCELSGGTFQSHPGGIIYKVGIAQAGSRQEVQTNHILAILFHSAFPFSTQPATILSPQECCYFNLGIIKLYQAYQLEEMLLPDCFWLRTSLETLKTRCMMKGALEMQIIVFIFRLLNYLCMLAVEELLCLSTNKYWLLFVGS